LNLTIASITVRGMLGRKRALLLFALPAILLALAGVLRATGSGDLSSSAIVLRLFAVGTLLPLLTLIAASGVIGPEIDDGQIMYLMTKPISRPVITTTKLVVAIGLVAVFAAVPTTAAGMILTGSDANLAVAFGLGILAGGAAYCALFLALSVVTRQPVTIGLVYALVWETMIANYAPRAKTLSIQQWAYSVTDSLTTATDIVATVSLSTALPLLAVVTVGGAVLAGWRMRSLTISGPE
jgi:ABC-2 type transport system permease protein